MIRIVIIIILTLFIMQTGCYSALDLPEAKVVVKVIDEDNKPLEGVEILIGFQSQQGLDRRIKEIAERGITLSDGLYSASKKCTDYIAYSAEKKGYYKSHGEFHFNSSSNGRWQPWNQQVTLVLRKIINPVPMYARKLDLELPAIGKDIGFDFIKYDWVEPYGKGTNSDMIFHLKKQFKSKDDFEGNLTVKFLSKFDGIQIAKENYGIESQLTLPRQAPEINYSTKLILLHKRVPGKSVESNYDKGNNYIFRIRSEERSGKLLRAMYGKIKGDIGFDAMNSRTAFIVFDYYLNPDYTTNLEFDPNRNLFTNLKSTERIGL